jgi:hypothetical protein
MKIRTLSLPLKLTFPSHHLQTQTVHFQTSLTVPPFTSMSCPTLYTFLSSLISTVDFSARIITSFSCAASSTRLKDLGFAC